MKQKIEEMTALELGEAIRQGSCSVVEVLEAYLGQMEKQEQKIGAFVTPLRKRAYEQAKKVQEGIRQGKYTSPLAGVPVAVKDNILLKGVRTTCASRMLENYVPSWSATVVEKLEEAGMIILGKTNMDEFAMGSTTETSYFGVTKNPWDTSRVPGGSSGGSAAAVAAGEVALALGSDTGGSIRQPASHCGVVGMKPSYGTVSRSGLIAYGSSLDQIGPLGKNVKDCAALLDVIKGKDLRDATSLEHTQESFLKGLEGKLLGLRVAVPKEFLTGGLQEDVRELFFQGLQVLTSRGAIVDFVSLKTEPYLIPAYYLIACAEASSNLERFDGVKYGYRSLDCQGLHQMYLSTRTEGFGWEVKKRILLGTFVLSAGYYDAYYLKAAKARRLLREECDRIFEKWDVILSPAAPTAAPALGQSLKDPLQMYLSDLYTVTANLAGLPAITVPCGTNSLGLPIGLQFMGAPFQDQKVLRAALGYEEARGSWQLPFQRGGEGK